MDIFFQSCAERKLQTAENTKKRMISNVWRTMGIDPENTPDHLTLGEIGLESMLAVDMQQELEKQYNRKLTLNFIKNITVKMMKDYESGKFDNIKKFIDEAKRGQLLLLKYKFVIPTETHTCLNGVKNGKPIYLMPPMEITFSAFEEWAQKINRPVIGLNWTKDLDNLSTMKDIRNYYLNLLTKLSPNGKYDVVGYFDGALISAKLLRKAPVDKAIIIDVLSDVRFQDEVITDDFLTEIMFQLVAHDLPESLKDKVLRDINSEADTNSKIRRMFNEFKEFTGKGWIANDFEEIFKIMIKRAKILMDYQKEKKNKISQLKLNIGKKWAKKTGKLIIIKPFVFDKVVNIDEFIDKTRDSYFLPNKTVCFVYFSNIFHIYFFD